MLGLLEEVIGMASLEYEWRDVREKIFSAVFLMFML